MRTYSDYLKGIFGNIKIQKISIDAGFSCPNRDGTIGTSGCIYCRNDSFSPSYCNPDLSVTQQLETGKKFFSRKYPDMKYLAYFQSYTGTYNKKPKELEKLYREALQVENIMGLVISTRPDCLDSQTIKLLNNLKSDTEIFIELGAESSHNSTLQLINRNHTWEILENAVFKVADSGLHCGVHLIAGLPGETPDMILETIDKTIKLPIETIKLHQLQVLKGTPLFFKLKNGEITVPEFSLEQYLNLCVEIVKRVPKNIIIERFLAQSPPELVVFPSWGLKNHEFMSKLAKLL